MDHDRYDALARRVDAAQSRRFTLGGIAALAALGLAMSSAEIDAKKKRRKKKRRKQPPPTCAETCGRDCQYCFTRATDSTLCGSIVGAGAIPCNAPCFSDNDCVGTPRPYCVTRYTDRETGESQQICPNSGGWCIDFDACGA
jgi:hypothetical protein